MLQVFVDISKESIDAIKEAIMADLLKEFDELKQYFQQGLTDVNNQVSTLAANAADTHKKVMQKFEDLQSQVTEQLAELTTDAAEEEKLTQSFEDAKKEIAAEIGNITTGLTGASSAIADIMLDPPVPTTDQPAPTPAPGVPAPDQPVPNPAPDVPVQPTPIPVPENQEPGQVTPEVPVPGEPTPIPGAQSPVIGQPTPPPVNPDLNQPQPPAE